MGFVILARGGVCIGLRVVMRGELNKLFGEGGCIIVVCNTKIGGADKLYEGMQDRFIVIVIWCPLVGGKGGHNRIGVRAG